MVGGSLCLASFINVRSYGSFVLKDKGGDKGSMEGLWRSWEDLGRSWEDIRGSIEYRGSQRELSGPQMELGGFQRRQVIRQS